MANYLPKGFRDYLYEGADTLHAASELVADTFSRWGFRRFVPSMVEQSDTLAQGAEDALLRGSFRFADRSGELLVLRPDMTLQAARVMAGELSEAPVPIRLFYADRVFRNVPEGKGALREIWQAGAELAGGEGVEADAEIIAIALEALASLGVRDVHVDLGHTAFVRDFLAGLNLAPEAAAQLSDALSRKDTRALQDLQVAGVIDQASWGVAQKLIGAFGLTGADELRAGGATSQPAIDNLLGILDVLHAYGVTAKITFDAGEVRALDYYTGFFFHIYAPGIGLPLAAGGRYDSLIGRFGRELPAVGCGIDLGAAAANVEAQRAKRVHIVTLEAQRTSALALARRLRDLGYAASRDIVRRPWEESLAFAKQAAMDFLILIEKDGKLNLIEVATNSRRELASADAIVQQLQASN